MHGRAWARDGAEGERENLSREPHIGLDPKTQGS